MTGLGGQGAGQARRHQRRQGIFLVVPADQPRQVRGIVFDGSAREAHAQRIALEPATDAQRAPGGDQHAAAANLRWRRFRLGIVDVEHREVRRSLCGEDARLGRRRSLESRDSGRGGRA